ncbi:MAG: stress response translation initiation inhibitor YciH [Candidatus Diapherotrites archaeon]|nr:stress response translation initiation inhibitor YciH [Candidatus Diapherotrites archaeon]
MNEICQVCGLPKNICVCKQIEKESQKIHIKVENRRFGKVITSISGLNPGIIKDVEKSLKRALACGGTIKGNVIELQGYHKEKAKEILLKEGFKEESITS